MGISMLGGIIQSILSGITGVIMAIVTPILEVVLDFVNRYIIGPLIQLAFNLISYAISLVFYGLDWEDLRTASGFSGRINDNQRTVHTAGLVAPGEAYSRTLVLVKHER